MRQLIPLVIAPVAILAGCGSSSAPPVTAPKQAPKAVKITQFYASPVVIPKGTSGSLCYGVENAAKVMLQPAVDEVWPSPSRCVQIRPDKDTRYTLTATGADGKADVKTLDVSSIEVAPEPRLFDLWVNALEVGSGEQVKICFKTEHADDVEISTGRLYKDAGCLTDYPKATTSYKIAAVAKGGGRDTRTVTVKVR